MRHRKQKFTLSRPAADRRVLARTLAIALLVHGKIQTSAAKAHFLQRFIEPLVTKGKRGDLHARRIVLQRLQNVDATRKLLARAATCRDRPGGYTRITKLPRPRPGDGAPQVLMEFVE